MPILDSSAPIVVGARHTSRATTLLRDTADPCPTISLTYREIEAANTEVINLNKQIDAKNGEISDATAKISATDAKIASLSGEITAAQKNVAARKNNLKDQLISLQKKAGSSVSGNVYIDFVLNSQSLSDLIARTMTVGKLSQASKDALASRS